MGKEAYFGSSDAKIKRKIYFIAQKFPLITVMCHKHLLFILQQFSLVFQELLREREKQYLRWGEGDMEGEKRKNITAMHEGFFSEQHLIVLLLRAK